MIKNTLIVNPFANLLADEDGCQLTSPVPNKGLQTLFVSRSESPGLYELFIDLSKLRLDFLDIKDDLNDDECELLFENGILIEEKNAPERTMYSCQLDKIKLEDPVPSQSNLVVNPSFRFEPLDLGKFNSFAREKNLSPYQSSAWIKTVGSKIPIGYWLNAAASESVSTLEPGKSVSKIEDQELLARLATADIVISPIEIEQRRLDFSREIKKKSAEFAKFGYVVLPEILPKSHIIAMQEYYRSYISNGFMPFGDDQVEGRYYQYNEPLAKFLHEGLTKMMSLIAGEEVKPSYVYAASYEEHADLKPHTDRPQCEYSFSFQVNYSPDFNADTSPWGLFLTKPDHDLNPDIGYSTEEFPSESQTSDDNSAVYLANGDAVAYKGCELIHYRYALPKGHKSTSLFFHYVPIDFAHDIS